MTRTIVSFYKLLLSHQHKFSPFPQPEAAARVVTGQTGPQSCYHQNVILTLDWRGSSLLCCAPVLVCVSAYNFPALSPLCILISIPSQGEAAMLETRDNTPSTKCGHNFLSGHAPLLRGWRPPIGPRQSRDQMLVSDWSTGPHVAVSQHPASQRAKPSRNVTIVTIRHN